MTTQPENDEECQQNVQDCTMAQIYNISLDILRKISEVESNQKKLSTSVIKLKTEVSQLKQSFDKSISDVQSSQANFQTKIEDLAVDHEVLDEHISQLASTLKTLGDNFSQQTSILFEYNKVMNTSINHVVQLNEELVVEKRSNEVKAECQYVKNTLTIRWKDSLSKRKKSYWHYYQNLKNGPTVP